MTDEMCDFCDRPAEDGSAICRACSWSERVMRYVENGAAS